MRGQLQECLPLYIPTRIIPARAGPTQNKWLVLGSGSDHPRSCGANLIEVGVLRRTAGSSPLVRGQLICRSLATMTSRIIPARAGPTRKVRWVLVAPSDHPRSCGANPLRMKTGQQIYGSSPLVRGQQTTASAENLRARIIPARAGPTCSEIICLPFNPDHPRSCGANGFMRTVTSLTGGSSPLVRGQLGEHNLVAPLVRIIPARAGPTC